MVWSTRQKEVISPHGIRCRISPHDIQCRMYNQHARCTFNSMSCLCLALCLRPGLFELNSSHLSALPFRIMVGCRWHSQGREMATVILNHQAKNQSHKKRFCVFVEGKPLPPLHAYDVLPISIAKALLFWADGLFSNLAPLVLLTCIRLGIKTIMKYGYCIYTKQVYMYIYTNTCTQWKTEKFRNRRRRRRRKQSRTPYPPTSTSQSSLGVSVSRWVQIFGEPGEAGMLDRVVASCRMLCHVSNLCGWKMWSITNVSECVLRVCVCERVWLREIEKERRRTTRQDRQNICVCGRVCVVCVCV